MPTMKHPRAILKYHGLFDFDGMYAAIIDWAKNLGYMWHEVDYKHKVPSPAGAEQEWLWLMTKDIDQFFSYKIQMKVHSWDLKEVEVEVDGKKKKLTNARIYIWIDASVTYDWQKKFKGNGKLTRWMSKVYEKVMEPEIAEYADTLYYRMWNLHAILKKFFDMQTATHGYRDYLGED